MTIEDLLMSPSIEALAEEPDGVSEAIDAYDEEMGREAGVRLVGDNRLCLL